jgi:hypothetical protein
MATSEDAAHGGAEAVPEPSMRVLEVVSDARDTTVADLPPLYDVVDPDSLDRLFEGRAATGWITFEYVDHYVTVRADGTVDVEPID